MRISCFASTYPVSGIGKLRVRLPPVLDTGRDNIVTGEDRLRGYLDALGAHGIPFDPALMLPGRFD